MFSAWGQIVSDTNPSFAYPYAFTGREYDPETGLYYYRARYYDPRTGRFLSEDPIGFSAGDANLHRYVGNQPTSLTDPTGLVASPPAASGWSKFLDGLQLGLDIIGLFPVYGEAADLLNALISAFRGKWGDAGLSLFAIIPVVGMAGTLGKWGKKGYKVFDKFVTTGAKIADEAADICKAKDGAKVTEYLGRAFAQAVKNTFRKKIIRENESIY